MDRLPRMHTAADRSREKDNVHLIEGRVVLYITLHLRDSRTVGQQVEDKKQLPPYPYPQWSQRLGGKRSLLNLSNMITIIIPSSSPAHGADRWLGWVYCDNWVHSGENPNI